MAKTVLVVDDDPTQRRLVQAVLDREGYSVVHAESGGEAIDRLTKGGGADVVLLDLVMPRMSGMECLAEIRTAGVTTPVIVLTANGGIETVVKAMQAGAQDFFIKPASPERILVGIRNALQLTQLTAEVGRLKKHVAGRVTFADLVGESRPMQMVKSLGSRAAKSSIPVLITGESGVGKEVIARALHGASDRAGKPFVAVNCGALPVNLVESILFGHEKGSFTGASDKHLGKFAEANGGTLFLDEIGELPLDMQVKLLRALQEGEIDPVGSRRSVKVDVRIVSATNRDLSGAVATGTFREDLFYRLNVFPIEAPALRDRREDIPALIDHFIGRFNVEEGKRVAGASAETLALLTAFDWPGNVRQLENTIHRAGRHALPSAARLPGHFRRGHAAGYGRSPSVGCGGQFRRPAAPARPADPHPRRAWTSAHAGGHRARPDPARHRCLCRPYVGDRAAARHRSLDPVPQGSRAGAGRRAEGSRVTFLLQVVDVTASCNKAPH